MVWREAGIPKPTIDSYLGAEEERKGKRESAYSAHMAPSGCLAGHNLQPLRLMLCIRSQIQQLIACGIPFTLGYSQASQSLIGQGLEALEGSAGVRLTGPCALGVPMAFLPHSGLASGLACTASVEMPGRIK